MIPLPFHFFPVRRLLQEKCQSSLHKPMMRTGMIGAMVFIKMGNGKIYAELLSGHNVF